MNRTSNSLVALAAAALLPLACAVQGPPDAAAGSGGAGDGGAGQATSNAGHVASSSSGGKTNPTCDDPPAPIDPNVLDVCPASVCAGGGRCVPTAIVVQNGGQEQADMLASCDQPDSKCVPDQFVASGGFFVPDTCQSLLGAEGRCLSTCIPEVKNQHEAVTLPQDVCPEFQVCVPCYDPQTGDATDACQLSCDEGPVEDPVLLPECCGGNGTCVPKKAVPADKIENLGDYGCAEETGGDFICAPNVFIADQNFKPSPCSDIGFLLKLLLPPDKQDGVCLPDCLPELDKSPVSKGDCQEGFLCAPCWKPGLIGPPKKSGACDF